LPEEKAEQMFYMKYVEEYPQGTLWLAKKVYEYHEENKELDAYLRNFAFM
jgi:hypothetical protein